MTRKKILLHSKLLQKSCVSISKVQGSKVACKGVLNMHHDPHREIDKNDYTRDTRAEAPATSPPPSAPPHKMPYYGGHMPKASGTKVPSRFALLILGCLPGLGHLYMGLIRRGLFYLSAAALAIFLNIQIAMHMPMFAIFTAFAIVAVYAVAFFESLVIRRDIAAGKELVDRLPAFVNNKRFVVGIAVFAIAVFALGFISSLPWYGWFVIAALGMVAMALGLFKKKAD